MKRPKVAYRTSGKPLLQHSHVRVPSAAEILESGWADDAAVRQHQPGAVAGGVQLVGYGAVLPALERRLQQPRRLEADHLLVPAAPLVGRVVRRIWHVLVGQIVMIV